MIKCPKCESVNISQYRTPKGPIWCNDCGYRVEQKEIDKSFFEDNHVASTKHLVSLLKELDANIFLGYMVMRAEKGLNLVEDSLIREVAEEAMISQTELRGSKEEDAIEDGFGSAWSKTCPDCGKDSMAVMRPGKVQCMNCG